MLEQIIPDFMKNWDNYETMPVRQFDLIIGDILDTLDNQSIEEAKQYMRGLRDGNRFGRKRPEMKKLTDNVIVIEE